MHYLGVAFLACWQGRRESWPTPHTRATFLPEGEREGGHILFYLSGPAGKFPRLPFTSWQHSASSVPRKALLILKYARYADHGHMKGLKDKQFS